MKNITRTILAASVAITMASGAQAADASGWVKDKLRDARAQYDTCSAEGSAITGTLSRVRNIALPSTGKVIVVNIASGVVTAYLDGEPQIESKAVVGKDTTQTPELDTHVTFVRPNPTWTVPQSIIKLNHWTEKLRTNPQFFKDNNFMALEGGKRVDPFEAAKNPSAVDTFVQMPGKGNALGIMKIGIENNQAIYLHDTNEPGKFASEVRAASHGCVRVEQVEEIAAWVMDITPEAMDEIVRNGSTDNLTPPEPVKVILGYWTAWPDKNDVVRFYPDIYGKDANCGSGTSAARDEGDGAERESPVPRDEPDEPRGPGPRFVPDDGTRIDAPQDGQRTGAAPGTAVPAWTEYQTR